MRPGEDAGSGRWTFCETFNGCDRGVCAVAPKGSPTLAPGGRLAYNSSIFPRTSASVATVRSVGPGFPLPVATTVHRNLDDEPASGLPPEVRELLSATDEAAEASAWSAFLDSYSRLILYIARKSCSGRDAAMDRYTYALEQLRRDDFARLRAYEVDDRARFSTWLAVVVRRLCTDFHRKRYGRYSSGEADEAEEPTDGPADADVARRTRRRLVDLVGEAVDIELLADHRGNPERLVRLRELKSALGGALHELESRDRLLLAMRFEDGHSARRIAEIMDYPSQFHVYRRLKKVLAVLRDDLEGRGIDGAAP